MMPSAPGCTSTTLPNSHRSGGKLSSVMTTMDQTSILWAPLVHLCRRLSSFIYSLCHLTQMPPDNRFGGVSVNSCSGMLVKDSPIRKWPGVRAIGSLGSDDIGDMGRELRMLSISIVNVFMSSKQSCSLPITRRTWCLNDFTAAYQIPPKWGDSGGINCHIISRFVRKLWTWSLCFVERKSFLISSISLRAPTKLVPLSLRIVRGRPRLETNHRSAAMKASVIISLIPDARPLLRGKQRPRHTL